jgi:hypothetical protein
MKIQPGTELDATDGITVYCDARECPAHENVRGHGRNEKEAFEVACEHYKVDRS